MENSNFILAHSTDASKDQIKEKFQHHKCFVRL